MGLITYHILPFWIAQFLKIKHNHFGIFIECFTLIIFNILFHILKTCGLAIKVKCYMYIKLNKDLSGLYKFYTNKWQGPALGAR